MSPLQIGLPLLSPLTNISRAVASGLDFLPFLSGGPTAEAATPPEIPSTLSSDPAIAELQQLIASELRSAGLGDSLPLDLADDGFGDIRITSDTLNRWDLERFLNDHPLIAQKFEHLANSSNSLRMTIADGPAINAAV